MHVRELYGIDPTTAMRCLSDRLNLTFLDSAAPHETLGRYSYLACDPFSTFVINDERAYCDGVLLEGDVWSALQTLISKYKQEYRSDLPPFQGGVAGFFAYDLNKTLDFITPLTTTGLGIPQSILHFYDVVIAYDHHEGRSWILSTGWPEHDPKCRDERALRRMDEVSLLLACPISLQDKPSPTTLIWNSNFSRERYIAAVQRVTDLILAGDIFQANIAQRFIANLPITFDPLGFYCRLRSINPAPFGALLRYGKLVVACSSPERFLKLTGSQVETRPIKGTIARCANPKQDQQNAAYLCASEKDRAENIMIVDLLRNDLSRVCTDHSVDVPVLCQLESYASVHHLTSVVTGKLVSGQNAVTLLRACFPGGSVTGVPKIRAMEIIADIEGAPREMYCGTIGFIGFNGYMDTNIVIRTVTISDHVAVFQAGGGITAMSEPAAEYEETLIKARRIFEAFSCVVSDII